jgi:hypothetical protein
VSDASYWVTLLLVAFTATGLLLSRDWRWRLGLLAAQYMGVFWMVLIHWPVSLAATKLVAGWMACTVLGIARLSAGNDKAAESAWPHGRLFTVFAAGMVMAVSFALSSGITDWLGLGLPVAWGSLLLIGLGLLHLGITTTPFRVIVGLLTVLAGFEVLYAAVESSALVTALMVAVNLGLAMAGAYLLNIEQETAS